MASTTTIQHYPAAADTSTAGRFRIKLGKEAVRLALNGNWARAAAVNRAILELHPEDGEAANRLAKALMELGDYGAARTALNELCRRSPANVIARKNLARLEKLEAGGAAVRPRSRGGAVAAGAPAPPLFIEDGGQSCTIALRRAGPPDSLAAVSAGDAAALTVSGDSVMITNGEGRLLGRVEPRLARRLRRLMAGGNCYSAAVVAVDAAAVSVIIRETARHPSLRNVVSFPTAVRPGVAGRQLNDEVAPERPDFAEAAREAGETPADGDGEETAVASVADEIDDDDAVAATAGEGGDVPVLDDDVAGEGLPALASLGAGAGVSSEGDDWE